MTLMKTTYSYDLREISEILVSNIENVLNEFDIDYIKYPNRISAACPVHNGDNKEGFSILTKGIGNWFCFSHGCHEQMIRPN